MISLFGFGYGCCVILEYLEDLEVMEFVSQRLGVSIKDLDRIIHETELVKKD